MQRLLKISRWIDRLTEGIGTLTSGLVLLMLLVGVWNVIGRYAGYAFQQNLSSNALIEWQWYLFDLVFFLGAAYTLKRDEHVRVDVFYGRCTGKRKALADLIGTVLFLIPFCLMVIVFSWQAIANSWATQEISPDPGGLLRYPIKSLIIVAYGLLILQGISEAIKHMAALTRPALEAPHDPSL